MEPLKYTREMYEGDIEYGEQRLGELLTEEESYTLKLTLPQGMSYREADTLAHQILAETAQRYDGAARFGLLGREFDSSKMALMSRKPAE